MFELCAAYLCSVLFHCCNRAKVFKLRKHYSDEVQGAQMFLVQPQLPVLLPRSSLNEGLLKVSQTMPMQVDAHHSMAFESLRIQH